MDAMRAKEYFKKILPGCYWGNTGGISLFVFLSFGFGFLYGQSGTADTYVNPVIPGDHPDPTLTHIGNDFYSSGSSFNPTPRIYHSTDLVHWEVISQPVPASWTSYGNSPGGGIWGGHMVLYNGRYWHFFGKGGGNMYFVTADQPEGPWSTPVRMNIPEGLWGLGVDNSIFIDDDNAWYLLTKAGPENNHMVELGNNGQPTGKVLDFTWLNPDAEDNPYGWAEGPVMWKHKGYYYYSFAQHLVGSQYVMRSDTLTDEQSAWIVVGTNIFTGSPGDFRTPNHISPAVTLDDGTSWVIAHSYHSDFYAQGRQGLLCEVIYDSNGFPEIIRPSTQAASAPALPSGGIPWMVPHSDMFDSEKLHPEWSFLGYTPANTHSLKEKPGWLKLSPVPGTGRNTVIKNDGERHFSLITKVDFEPESPSDEAGLWIINGPETHKVKVYSSMNPQGKKVVAFSFGTTKYEVENTVGSMVWLKLVRNEHHMYGYFSADGNRWTQIGTFILALDIDTEQTQFNNFTGNQQGLYIQGKDAFFDLYIYRDAYSPLSAACPANHYKTSVQKNSTPPHTLTSINQGDWAMFAGVEFGNPNYPKRADSVSVYASSATAYGGSIEVLLDSLTGTKIAEINVSSTGSWSNYKTFTAPLTKEVTGCHDVFLAFRSSFSWELLRLKTFTFSVKDGSSSVFDPSAESTIDDFRLEQNYPNPFQSVTQISFYVPRTGHISLKICDINGTEIRVLHEGLCQRGIHRCTFHAEGLSDGVYLCRLETEDYTATKNIRMIKQN
jgi:xylan 1,4-beta-xylosidase